MLKGLRLSNSPSSISYTPRYKTLELYSAEQFETRWMDVPSSSPQNLQSITNLCEYMNIGLLRLMQISFIYSQKMPIHPYCSPLYRFGDVGLMTLVLSFEMMALLVLSFVVELITRLHFLVKSSWGISRVCLSSGERNRLHKYLNTVTDNLQQSHPADQEIQDYPKKTMKHTYQNS